jgi:uncharacterized membrane protein
MGRRRMTTRLLGGNDGNVAIMAAITAPLIIYGLSLGLDYGMLTLQQRKLQQTADLAALVGASDVANAQANVLNYFTRNNLDIVVQSQDGGPSDSGQIPGMSATGPIGLDGVAVITKGTYVGDAARSVGSRFVANALPNDAVKVAVQQKGGLYFASVFAAPPQLTAVGTASTEKVAAFSIGSRLASLNGGLVNAVLGKLLGTSLSVDTMDYQSLVSANIDTLSVIDSLATNLNLTAGTYSDVLEAKISYNDLVKAILQQAGLSSASRRALSSLQSAANTTQVKFNLGEILALGPVQSRMVGSGSHLSLTTDIMSLVSAAAVAANGANQIDVNLNGTIPGLSTVQLSLAIGEPPQKTAPLGIGAVGSMVRTAQTRLKLTITIDGAAALLGLKINVPLYVEMAYAEGKLAKIACLGNGVKNANVSIDTTPGVADLFIGNVDATFSDFSTEPTVSAATLIDSTLVKVSASSHVAVTNLAKSTLIFSPSDISNGTIHSAATHDTLTSTVTSLLGNATYSIKILLLTIGTQASLQQALSASLAHVTSPLDDLLNNLLMVVGVKIGEADVRVTDARCQQPALVQ